MSHLDENPTPNGDLAIQTIVMPKDANANGDILGGWLVSQMDIAASFAAQKVASGRVVTVAIDSMSFLVPVKVGALVGCYTDVLSIGRSSIQVLVEVWIEYPEKNAEKIKVTEGQFVFVAIDENGRTKEII